MHEELALRFVDGLDAHALIEPLASEDRVDFGSVAGEPGISLGLQQSCATAHAGR